MRAPRIRCAAGRPAHAVGGGVGCRRCQDGRARLVVAGRLRDPVRLRSERAARTPTASCTCCGRGAEPERRRRCSRRRCLPRAEASPRAIVSGWSRIDDVAAAVFKGRPLSVVFTGTKTDTTGDPTEGLNLATSSGGAWTVGSAAIYKTDFAGSSVPSVGFTRSGTLVQAWSGNGEVLVHVGVDPAVPARRIGKGGNVTAPGLERGGEAPPRSRSASWSRWCGTGDLLRVEFGSDTPSPLRRLAGSETTRCPAASRTAYTRNPEGVDNSSAAASVGVGTNGAVLVQRRRSADGGRRRAPGSSSRLRLAADPNGRVWVGWRDADTGQLRFRRSNGCRHVRRRRLDDDPGVSGRRGQPRPRRPGRSRRRDRAHDQGIGRLALPHPDVPGPHRRGDEQGRTRHRRSSPTPAFPSPAATSRVGGHLLHTGADGRAVIELPSGSYDVTAAKTKYVGATTGVRVKPH